MTDDKKQIEEIYKTLNYIIKRIYAIENQIEVLKIDKEINDC